MNERQKRAVCERLARLCREEDLICPVTRLSKACPNWEALCPLDVRCEEVTQEDWKRASKELSAYALIESYGGVYNG